MGIRADFYTRKNKKLKWLGSTAWDGYGVAIANSDGHLSPNNRADRTTDYLEYLIHHSKSCSDFEELVLEYLEKRDDGTLPKHGWPWPWNNSKLTDECYVFDAESNRLLRMGRHDGVYDDHTTECLWGSCSDEWYDDEDEELTPDQVLSFCVPDMSEIKNVARGDRSGLLIISS